MEAVVEVGHVDTQIGARPKEAASGSAPRYIPLNGDRTREASSPLFTHNTCFTSWLAIHYPYHDGCDG